MKRQPLHGVPVPLPGMENHERERAEVLATEQGEELTRQMLTPRASIERQAGELETFSPLFRGTPACPQSDLFAGLTRSNERLTRVGEADTGNSLFPCFPDTGGSLFS